MNIGIDFDGVIVATEHLFEHYAAIFSQEREMECVNPEAWSVVPRYDWTREDLQEFHELYNAVCTFEADVMEGVGESINKLRSDGHSLFLVTARSDRNYDGSYSPEKKRALKVLSKLGITFDKYCWLSDDKVSVCKENAIDVIIEDRPYHCEKLANAGIFTLHFKDKLNTQMQENENLKNVKSWQEVLTDIEKFQKQKENK